MRHRKPVAGILIAAFVLMTADCVSTKRIASTKLTPDEKDYRIVSVLKRTGERIDIDRSNPAYVAGGEIRINGVVKVPDSGTTVAKTDGGLVLTTDKGSAYETEGLGRKAGQIVFRTKSEIAISLSDVSAVWARQKDTLKTVLAVALGAAVVFVGAVVIGWISFNHAVDSIHWPRWSRALAFD